MTNCERCNEIRALPWSPTRRDMTADHTMERVCQARSPQCEHDFVPDAPPHEGEIPNDTPFHQWMNRAVDEMQATFTESSSVDAKRVRLFRCFNAIIKVSEQMFERRQARPVEAPKGESEQQMRTRLEKAIYAKPEPVEAPKGEGAAYTYCMKLGDLYCDVRHTHSPKPEPAKPPESETLASSAGMALAAIMGHEEPGTLLYAGLARVLTLIEADAQRLKDRDEEWSKLVEYWERQAKLADDRAEKAERELDRARKLCNRVEAESMGYATELAAVKGGLARIRAARDHMIESHWRVDAQDKFYQIVDEACAKAEAGE